MTDFDFADARAKISEINKIVETCPEPLKEKVFELLFRQVFDQTPKQAQPNAPEGKPIVVPLNDKPPPPADEVKLPGNVLAFLRRHGVDRERLDKLFMLDQNPYLPVYKITTQVVAKAQLQKVMMILLENAILNGSFKANYREVREACKEAGLYDGNFNKALKGNATLFKGAVTADKINDEAEIELTGEGQTKLAELVAELAGPA